MSEDLEMIKMRVLLWLEEEHAHITLRDVDAIARLVMVEREDAVAQVRQ
jgi:hypothetical protein